MFGLFQKKKREGGKYFQPADFVESVEELHNPKTGWYQLHTYLLSEPFDASEEIWALDKEQRLVLVIIHLGNGKNEDLSGEELEKIGQILDFFAVQKKDIILRFVYDTVGRGMEHEPNRFSQVSRHMEQLGEILSRFREKIYIYQGVLLGSWGEMHTSKFLSNEKIRTLMKIIEKSVGEDVFRAVRRPVDIRLLGGAGSEKRSGLTCFDDAVFGSSTHLGTFGEGDGSDPSVPWNREKELEFLAGIGERVPVGGEAVCPGDGNFRSLSLAQMVGELRQMHMSYLNCRHDRKLLDYWQQCEWQENGVWDKMNGYDYIGRHLGYRFCVRSCAVRREKEKWTMTVKIENTGFSPVYEELGVILVHERSGGEKEQRTLRWNPGKWRAGEVTEESVQWAADS